MTDVPDRVGDHYRAPGLTEPPKAALTALGAQDRRLAPRQFGAIDGFHTRGLAASAEAAQYLTRRTGQGGQVSFETASALDPPFDDGRFEVVLLQHVAMNIADRLGIPTAVSEAGSIDA
jgi:sarcosine/dimethylglycine N-methyltransferase